MKRVFKLNVIIESKKEQDCNLYRVSQEVDQYKIKEVITGQKEEDNTLIISQE